MSTTHEHITAGQGGLSKVVLVAPDGARAEIYLHGAHVTSWVPAGDSERLFLSARSVFRPDAAIRGGIPVIFPQFANVGPLPKHGFARTSAWQLVDVSPDGTATFQFSHSPATHAIWPREFVAELAVTVGGPTLDLALAVQNVGDDSMTFTAALHTYLEVADVRETTVRGLSGRTYRTGGTNVLVDESDSMSITGEIDRVYLDVPTPIDVVEPTRSTRLTMAGFDDVVVWNPGAKGTAALSDMEPEGYLRMLCIEAAAVGRPVVITPGGTWTGSQRLTARSLRG